MSEREEELLQAYRTGAVQYPGPAGAVSAYQSRPKTPDRRPVVVVIHENRGLAAYIEDVARRLARAGCHALAPDLLSRCGSTAARREFLRSPGRRCWRRAGGTAGRSHSQPRCRPRTLPRRR